MTNSDELAMAAALSDPEERRVLHAALDSFRQYRHAAHYNITHVRRQAFYSLPSAHVDILSSAPFSLPETFQRVDDAIDLNAEIAEAILSTGLPSFGVKDQDERWKGKATSNDVDKARSTIRQLYRDWSAEGAAERHACFSPILKSLETYLSPVSLVSRDRYRILVPGAGLGRLVFELCAAGWSVEGNEISYHQLLVSNHILNYTQAKEEHTIFPWALSFSNHLTRENQLRSVTVPDVHPATFLEAADATVGSDTHFSERMSMSAGDFCVVYREPEYKGTFDAVATCFFIDTAPNVINYIETVASCLRAGGIWTNLGPLLWHFESAPTPAEKETQRQTSTKSCATSHSSSAPDDSNQGIGDPGSFELSNDEVIALLSRYGFEVLEQEQVPAGATGYIQDPASMLQNIYKPVFWVARKT